MGCAAGLIALGVGYMVFLSATKEKGGMAPPSMATTRQPVTSVS